MKFTILICLLVVTTASANYVDGIIGSPILNEVGIQLSQCPAYDDPNHIVMLPYPNDCRKYYSCYNGLAYAHQCPENYYWSQLTYRCDFKQYSNCQNDEFPDVMQPIMYSAFPGDCTRFYETRIRRCPNNYQWNAHYQRCDLPQLAGCDAYPVITLPPVFPQTPYAPTAATPPAAHVQPTQPEYGTAPIDPEYLCKNRVQAPYLPYPGDCQKFIYCGPIASVLTCPIGLFWDRNTLSCGSSNVGCLL